jgi:hypothetical protein
MLMLKTNELGDEQPGGHLGAARGLWVWGPTITLSDPPRKEALGVR